MHNMQKNQFTIMEFSDVQIDKGIPNNKFSERMMKRGI